MLLCRLKMLYFLLFIVWFLNKLTGVADCLSTSKLATMNNNITSPLASRQDFWIFPTTEAICLGITNALFLALGIPGNILVILSTRRMVNCKIKQLLMNMAVSHLIYIFILPITVSCNIIFIFRISFICLLQSRTLRLLMRKIISTR